MNDNIKPTREELMKGIQREPKTVSEVMREHEEQLFEKKVELRREDGWEYIGDGVYGRVTDYHDIELVTYNGMFIGNHIVLDPTTYANFTRFIAEKMQEKK